MIIHKIHYTTGDTFQRRTKGASWQIYATAITGLIRINSLVRKHVLYVYLRMRKYGLFVAIRNCDYRQYTHKFARA